jgi:hypothetical protein
MQFFVRGTCTMIDAAVQRDVDGIPKGSHYVRVPIIIVQPNAAALPVACRAAGRRYVAFDSFDSRLKKISCQSGPKINQKNAVPSGIQYQISSACVLLG